MFKKLGVTFFALASAVVVLAPAFAEAARPLNGRLSLVVMEDSVTWAVKSGPNKAQGMLTAANPSATLEFPGLVTLGLALTFGGPSPVADVTLSGAVSYSGVVELPLGVYSLSYHGQDPGFLPGFGGTSGSPIAPNPEGDAYLRLHTSRGVAQYTVSAFGFEAHGVMTKGKPTSTLDLGFLTAVFGASWTKGAPGVDVSVDVSGLFSFSGSETVPFGTLTLSYSNLGYLAE